jgi:hypothetical protein
MLDNKARIHIDVAYKFVLTCVVSYSFVVIYYTETDVEEIK